MDLAVVASDFEGTDELERYDLIREDVGDVFGSTSVDVLFYTPEEFERGTEAFLPHLIEEEGIRV